MGLKSLIQAALIAVLLAHAVGSLHRFVGELRIAQIELIKRSQASKWGRAMLLPESRGVNPRWIE